MVNVQGETRWVGIIRKEYKGKIGLRRIWSEVETVQKVSLSLSGTGDLNAIQDGGHEAIAADIAV